MTRGSGCWRRGVVLSDLTGDGVVDDRGELGSFRKLVFPSREIAVQRQGGPFLLLEAVQRTHIRHGFGVSEGGGDLRIATHEGAVIASRPPRGNSEVYRRTPGDVQPSGHASGEQVRANFEASFHVVFGQNFWAARGERAFAGFANFGSLRLLDLKDLANCKSRRRLLYH